MTKMHTIIINVGDEELREGAATVYETDVDDNHTFGYTSIDDVLNKCTPEQILGMNCLFCVETEPPTLNQVLSAVSKFILKERNNEDLDEHLYKLHRQIDEYINEHNDKL